MMTRNKRYINLRNDCLTCCQIQSIAETVACSLGFPIVDKSAVREMYDAVEPLPIVLKCRRGILWVDKYYGAYQLGDADVRYFYMTRQHIREESASYQEAARERGTLSCMPVEIQRVFVKLGYGMFLKKHLCWIDKNFLVENTEKGA